MGREGRGPGRVQMIEPHVGEVLPGAERIQQRRGRGACAMHKEIGAAPHHRDGVGGGDSVGFPVEAHGKSDSGRRCHIAGGEQSPEAARAV